MQSIKTSRDSKVNREYSVGCFVVVVAAIYTIVIDGVECMATFLMTWVSVCV